MTAGRQRGIGRSAQRPRRLTSSLGSIFGTTDLERLVRISFSPRNANDRRRAAGVPSLVAMRAGKLRSKHNTLLACAGRLSDATLIIQ